MDSNLKMKLDFTDFCVEATDFEQHCLWEQAHAEFKWREDKLGHGPIIGHVGKRPVALSLRWCMIDRESVLFYYSPSEVVDHKMIGKWLTKNCKAYEDGRRTNATNFHQCLSYVRGQVP